jgi:hypothetical protein
MRQAVVALDLAMLHGEYPQDAGIFREISNAANALSARLAQPEPEPVAWRHTWDGAVDLNDLTPWYYGDHWKHEPLYTAPPQREWQSLTDEEVEIETARVLTTLTKDVWPIALSRAIEELLRRKNT